MHLNKLGDFVKKYSRDRHAAIFRISLAQDGSESKSDLKPQGEVHVPFASPSGSKKSWRFECSEHVIPIESDSANVQIELNLENALLQSKWYPISGFPRQLMKEDYMTKGTTPAITEDDELPQYESSAIDGKEKRSGKQRDVLGCPREHHYVKQDTSHSNAIPYYFCFCSPRDMILRSGGVALISLSVSYPHIYSTVF